MCQDITEERMGIHRHGKLMSPLSIWLSGGFSGYGLVKHEQQWGTRVNNCHVQGKGMTIDGSYSSEKHEDLIDCGVVRLKAIQLNYSPQAGSERIRIRLQPGIAQQHKFAGHHDEPQLSRSPEPVCL